MKIFIFTKLFPENNFIGGAEIQAYLLAKYLTKRGHEISYLCCATTKEAKEKTTEGFKINYLAGAKDNKLKLLINFYKKVKLESPNIVFCRDFNFLFWLDLICKISKIPLVYNTTHINNCQPYPKKIKISLNLFATLSSIKSAWSHFLNFTALKKIKIITINKLHARLLQEKYRISATPIYNSMEDDFEKNKFFEKEKNIIWVANLKSRKRPEIFIQLAEDLKDTKYKFIMIGYIQNNAELYHKLILQAQNNNPAFEYQGGRPLAEVNKILAQSQIFVNTCQPEGFGNNFIQAWLNQCPTVTLKFDPDNIIKQNKIGFHSKNYEQLKKDILFLINNQSVREEMGEKARVYALNNHLPEKNIVKYETYFNQILDVKKNQ